jgi:uncharacterized protein
MKELALITGATNGIGLEFAKIFAKNGIDLFLVGRNEDKLQEIKSELENHFKIQIHVFQQDLSKNDAAKNVFHYSKSKYLKVNYLINNAGFGDFGFFHESEWEKYNEMINLNISTLTELCHSFSKEMINAKSGKILNVASTAAFQSGPLMAVYFATKAYVLSFSEALNNELKDFGISVTTLCPGPTESGFQKLASMEESNLVKNKKLPSSKDVALFGYNSMMNNKSVVIHGIMNKIMVFSVRLSPRSIALKMVRYLMK